MIKFLLYLIKNFKNVTKNNRSSDPAVNSCTLNFPELKNIHSQIQGGKGVKGPCSEQIFIFFGYFIM